MKEGWEVDEGVVEVKRVKVSVGGLRDMVVCGLWLWFWFWLSCIVGFVVGCVVLSLHYVLSFG